MVFMDRCYPPRSSYPSCIQLSASSGNNYELKPQYITMLPKFAGADSNDAYMFINEFEEVYAMLKIKELTEDAIKLRFIPFMLRDVAKKWLYSLATNSITTWKDFVEIFLKKFFPRHKTAKSRSAINQLCQNTDEPFWKYLDRFKDLLSQCPHHGIER